MAPSTCQKQERPVYCVPPLSFLSDRRYVDHDFQTATQFGYEDLIKQHEKFEERIKFWTPEVCLRQPHLFDFVITVLLLPPNPSLTIARRRRHSPLRILAFPARGSSRRLFLPRQSRIPHSL